MSANPKRKMCWNCDGNVELEEEICPYCQTTFGTQQEQIATHSSALYPSAYSKQKIIQATPFSSEEEKYLDNSLEDASDDDSEDEDDESSIPTLYTLSLLMAGSLFMLFGFVLFLFSSNGQLVLRWNSSYWYMYMLLALPMLYMSVSKLSLSSDE